MKCPDCQGKGGKECYTLWSGVDKAGNRTHGSGLQYVPCRRCEDAGEIPKEMLIWQEQGKKLREHRMKARLSQRDFAFKHNLIPSQYADMEAGYRDPSQILDQILP